MIPWQQIFDYLSGQFGLGVAVAAAIFFVFYFTQNRAGRLGRWIARCGTRISTWISNLARASKVQLTRTRTWTSRRRVQRYMRKIVNTGTADRPFLTTDLRLEWADEKVSFDSFLREDRFIVVVPTELERDRAVIEGIFLFVSRSLLPRQKRYLSNAQRQAIDLYTTGTILETASRTLADQFNLLFVQSRTVEERAFKYLREFERLSRYGLFDEILLQELDFLGIKGLPLEGSVVISQEFDALLDMLAELSRRQAGVNINLTLERRYCRCGIVIVGRSYKVTEGPEPWVKFIRENLVPRLIDSVYILSAQVNAPLAKEIAQSLSNSYTIAAEGRRKVLYLDSQLDRYHCQLRSRGAGMFTPEENGDLRVKFSTDVNPALDIISANQNGQLVGTISLISSDGNGLIRLDDPSFDSEVQFEQSAIIRRPAVVSVGDKVVATIIKSSGIYRATNVEIVFPAELVESHPSTDEAETPEHDLEELRDEVFSLVAAELASSEVPLGLPWVANLIREQVGEKVFATGWAGAGGLKQLLIELELGQVITGPGVPGWLYDPERHEIPQTGAMPGSYAEVDDVIEVVASCTGAPRLSQRQLRVLFEQLAEEIRENEYELGATSRAVRDRCEALGEPIGRNAINFILKGLRLAGVDLSVGREHVSAEWLRRQYRDHVVAWCRKNGESLTSRQIADVDAWIVGPQTINAPAATERTLFGQEVAYDSVGDQR